MFADRANIKAAIQRNPLFAEARERFVEESAEQSKVLDCTKGKVLFVHGDEAQRFFLVQSGWVKLFRETLDGAQAVVDILTSGSIFGETSIFQGDVYPYSAEVIEPSLVVSLPLVILKKEIEENSKMAIAMLAAMARYRRQQDQEIEHRTLQSAPQRIGCFLLKLVDQKSDGRAVIHLPYDKTLLASRLGMQPETFSRALAKLKDAANLKVVGATIEIDNLERLVDYSCSACSSQFPCKEVVEASG